MRIEKKIWPEFFEKVVSGEKTFEVRLNDFECKPGDVLVLREWDPTTKEYTGRGIEKRVTSSLKLNDLKFWPKEVMDRYGLQVIGFK